MKSKRKKDWTPLPADAIAVLVLYIGIPVLAVATGVLLPLLGKACIAGDKRLFILAIGAAVIGIAGLAIAKYPLWRRGTFMSVGPSGLTGAHRRLYWIAYTLIVLGAFLLGLLLVAVRPR